MNKKSFFKPWIHFVSKRFSSVERKGTSAVTTKLSAIGICFGVMTLIVVMSVMNGFQMQFIDSIIELSSYHVQVETENEEQNLKVEAFLNEVKSKNNVVSFVPFKEAQSLITNKNGKEAAGLIRGLPSDVLKLDSGFNSEINMINGDFDLTEEDSVVLGVRLANQLGVHRGSVINLFALSGSGETSLISNNRTLTVKGIFSCGYADINASYAFINLDTADKYFASEKTIYGIKLKNQNSDKTFQKDFAAKFPDVKTTVWRDYNRSFFGALRVEKNMLFLFVILIFIVVTINIFNSMRKLVFERRVEICTLASLGSDNRSVKTIFIVRAFLIGLKGSIPGMILGLILSYNIKGVFIVLSKLEYWFTYLFTAVTNPQAKAFVKENTMWYVYSNIPARVMPGEVAFITLFGIFSCLIAAYAASRNVLKMKISEVFHED